jgi:hypothetical protein
LTRETNQLLSQAWHVAYLSRISPDKFPKLDKLLTKTTTKSPRRFQDPEARWRALAAAASHARKH